MKVKQYDIPVYITDVETLQMALLYKQERFVWSTKYERVGTLQQHMVPQKNVHNMVHTSKGNTNVMHETTQNSNADGKKKWRIGLKSRNIKLGKSYILDTCTLV